MEDIKQNAAGIERAEDAFSVSVMPKEFRGKEGLMRPYAQEPRYESDKPATLTAPLPMVQKQITPATAVGSQFDQHILAPRRTPWLLIGLSGFVAVLIIGLALVVILKPATPDPVVPVAVKPSTVTNTVPVPKPVAPEPPAAPEAPVAPESPKLEILPGKDTDSDGLTDVEEELYGTQANKPDTDQDGFLDGNEVFHLFHPDGFAPKTLLDTGAVAQLKPEGMAYMINVVTKWQHTVSTDDGTLKTTAPSGEVFTVIQHAVPASTSLQQYYTDNITAPNRQNLEPFRTKQGYTGIWTQDHLTAYVRFSDDVILEVIYTLGGATRIEYRQTFEMFINSLTGLLQP